MRNNNWTNRATRVVQQVLGEVAAVGEHMGGLMPYEIEAVQRAMRLRTWIQRRRFRRRQRVAR